jgi:hypothetical protein
MMPDHVQLQRHTTRNTGTTSRHNATRLRNMARAAESEVRNVRPATIARRDDPCAQRRQQPRLGNAEAPAGEMAGRLAEPRSAKPLDRSSTRHSPAADKIRRTAGTRTRGDAKGQPTPGHSQPNRVPKGSPLRHGRRTTPGLNATRHTTRGPRPASKPRDYVTRHGLRRARFATCGLPPLPASTTPTPRGGRSRDLGTLRPRCGEMAGRLTEPRSTSRARAA